MSADEAFALQGLADDPIGERGIHEDSVAMPGGGQRPIDDLEASGELTPDLIAKARPSVQPHLRASGPHAMSGAALSEEEYRRSPAFRAPRSRR